MTTNRHNLALILLFLPVELAMLVLGLGIAWLASPEPNHLLPELFIFLVVGLILACVRGIETLKRLAKAGDEMDKLRTSLRNLHAGMDPWDSQLRLMLISNQSTPSTPRVTKETALYAALIAEEGGETLVATADALGEVCGRNSGLWRVANQIAALGTHMQSQSKDIRKLIGALSDQEWLIAKAMSYEAAKSLLDGYTDLHVVTAGGSIASGLPGAEAYTEVASSNLSKANPDTGMIDKDAGGKWIKGRNYREPDLGRVLAPFYEGAEQ